MSNMSRLHVKYVETTCQICAINMSQLWNYQHLWDLICFSVRKWSWQTVHWNCFGQRLNFRWFNAALSVLPPLPQWTQVKILGWSLHNITAKEQWTRGTTQLKHLDKRNWLVWPLPQTFWYDDSKMKYFRLTGDILRTQSFCGLQSVHAYLCWRGSLSHHSGIWVPAWSVIAIT